MCTVSKPLTNCASVAPDSGSRCSSSWRSLLDSGPRSGSSNVARPIGCGLETMSHTARGGAYGDRDTGAGGDTQTMAHLVPQYECRLIPHRGAVPCEPLSDAAADRGVASPDSPARGHAGGGQTELRTDIQIRQPSGAPDPNPVGRVAGLFGDLHKPRHDLLYASASL